MNVRDTRKLLNDFLTKAHGEEDIVLCHTNDGEEAAPITLSDREKLIENYIEMHLEVTV